MPNRPISRAKRTGGSEKTPKTNSLPETARPMQPSVDKVLEQPVAKTIAKTAERTVTPSSTLPTNVPPMPPLPNIFDNVSSDEELLSADEIVENVAKKSQITNRTQNGK